MRIMCGYANDGLRSETKEALVTHAPGVEFLDFTGDDHAYWNAIKERWTGDDDLIVIEQDMVIQEDTISSFENCDQDWCSFGYTALPHLGRINAALGCVRFSARVQKKYSLDTYKDDVDWRGIDVHIGWILGDEGLRPHDHGDITHLHDYGNLRAFDITEADNPAPGIYTSNEFCYFVPPSLIDAGDEALLGFPAQKDEGSMLDHLIKEHKEAEKRNG